MGNRLPRDDNAAFPVLEAILVAVLILTTILFFTSLQRPTTATDEGGIDLGRLAADTLDILQTKEFTTTGACLAAADLETWVTAVLNGQECAANELEKFLGEVLPPGTQFLVRLDNGVEPLVLVPYGSTDSPRAARAEATYITPLWLANVNKTGSQSVFPGQQLVYDNGTLIPGAPSNATAFKAGVFPCIASPTGSATGPDGSAWAVWWQANATHVPADLPYGAWAGYPGIDAEGECTGTLTPTYLFIGLPDGTRTDYPVYGLQLVVWFGA